MFIHRQISQQLNGKQVKYEVDMLISEEVDSGRTPFFIISVTYAINRLIWYADRYLFILASTLQSPWPNFCN